MKNQEWFNKEFPKEAKEIEIKHESFEEQLIVEDYLGLEEISLYDIEGMDKLIFKSLPQLQEFNIRECKIQSLVIENCPQLTGLEFLADLDKLEELKIDGNTSLIEILKPYQGDWKACRIAELAKKNPQKLLKTISDLREEKDKNLISQQKYNELKGFLRRTLTLLSQEAKKDLIDKLDREIKRKGSLSDQGRTEELMLITDEVIESAKELKKELEIELIKAGEKIQDLKEENEETRRQAEERRVITLLIPVEKLYATRRSMDKFLNRWEDRLPNLQLVERFNYTIRTVKWANRGVLVASGIQLIRGDSSMSDWTTLISPFVEVFISNLQEKYESNKLKQTIFADDTENVWDNYNELRDKAILDSDWISLFSEENKNIKDALKDLISKVNKFWEKYDINNDGKIDDEELKLAKEKFPKDWQNNWVEKRDELKDIKETIEKLRIEVSSYRKSEAKNLEDKSKRTMIIQNQSEITIDLDKLEANQSLNNSQANLLNKSQLQQEEIEMQAKVQQADLPYGTLGVSK